MDSLRTMKQSSEERTMGGYEEQLQKLRGSPEMLEENLQRIVRETVEDAAVAKTEASRRGGMLEKRQFENRNNRKTAYL